MGSLLLLSSLLVLSALEPVSSSIPCGFTGLACIYGKSICSGGSCTCTSPYFWGNPFFMCYPADTVACEIKNDPSLTNFNNDTTQFPYPCRFMLTHVRQNLVDQDNNVIGHCEFQAFGFNQKSKGKMYVHGFDAAIRLDYSNGTTVAVSLRRYGTEQNGITSEGTTGMFLPHGPWGNEHPGFEDPDNGVVIDTYYNVENRQVVFEAIQCGIRLTFVPFDEILRREAIHVPGISVAVYTPYDPIWLSKDITMGLPPVDQGGQRFADIQGFWLNKPQSVVVRAFLSGIEQNQPDGAVQCTTGQTKLRACTELTLAEAMEACFWMLEEPRFIKCFDREDSANNLLSIFNMCVESFCERRRSICHNVINIIKAFGCHNIPNIFSLDAFVKGEFCPPLP